MLALRTFTVLGRRFFRTYRLEILLAFTFFAGALANADELRVVEVRRNIPLADTDPVYKDFYISGSGAAGLKPNLVVQAVRKTSMKDATGTQSLGEMLVPVGQLKVIFVQNNLAVAREHKLHSRKDLPMLEQTGIMAGDQIDLKGSFTDKKTASVTKPKTVVKAKSAKPATVTLITAALPEGTALPGAVLSKTETSDLAKEAPKALPEKKEATQE